MNGSPRRTLEEVDRVSTSTGFFEAMQNLSGCRQALPRQALTRKAFFRFWRGEISQGGINPASSRFRIEEPKTFNIYSILYFLFLFYRRGESHGSDNENNCHKTSRSRYMDATGVVKLNIESFRSSFSAGVILPR